MNHVIKFRGAMKPPKRKIDWTELGWRVIPYVCAVAAAVVVYVVRQ